jgi:hypothetical protein
MVESSQTHVNITQIIPQHLTEDFIVEVDFVYGVVTDLKKIPQIVKYLDKMFSLNTVTLSPEDAQKID